MKHLFKKAFLLMLLACLVLSNQADAIGKSELTSVVGISLPPDIPFFSTENVLMGADTTTHSQIDIDQIADSLTQKVIGENKIVDLLDPGKVYTLPIGIGKNIGGLYYIIVLDELRFTPSGLTAKAYISLSFPGSTKKFGLVADNVKIGVGGIQAAQLKMLRDKPIDLPGGNILTIKADSTFIEWDCNGYKSTQLSAKLELDPAYFYKENPQTRSIITGAMVKGKINCSIVDFNDILVSIKLDPFQVKGLKDFSFYPREIVLDMSDTRNAVSMQFPSGFQSALFDGSNKNLWRGVYINSFTLKFPKTFAKSGPPPEVTASRFLIDFEGITGSLTLNYPLITLDQGSLGGWKFSVNSLSLSLSKSDIAGFAMAGGIVLPITDPNKLLSYRASIDGNQNFLFQVTLPGDLNVPLFGSGSSVQINSNSVVSVASRDGEFYPKAILNGKMKIAAGGSNGASLADITFQGLTIQREEPQLDIQALSMQSGAMAGFPIQINSISVLKDAAKKDLGLKFDVKANLMSGKIEGATSFVVWATRARGNWEYKDLEFRKILVDADMGSVALKGMLVKYKDDPTYGNGYLGSVDMSITPGLAVSATAQFGNISSNRYWYADASLAISSGMTLFPGFAIYGFGGGAYYHMQRNVPANVFMETKPDTAKIPIPGKASSGITYTPNPNIALGLTAKVIIGTQPSPKAFNGNVTFGLEFNSNFGLNKVFFEGDGRFMTEVTDDGSNSKVKAAVSIQYLFDNKELSGYADAYINVADAIKGNGANNLAGRVEFYFARSKWHIYVGTPTSPVNVKIMNTLSATSYFMVGTELPDFPSLPSEVSSLSSDINFSNMRSNSLAGSGGGFAFGASIRASTGDKNFLIFYGKFDLGAGFDLMLKNFGNDARCEGFSGPLGINGWYAQGQAWAFVNAKIGVRVKVFRTERKFSIMDAGFAAALGAQLPNPTYLAGAVEAHFSVLGGLVKGNCHFEFDYGTQCKLTNASAVEGINVIAELTPAEGGKDVDVFLAPQVAFNMPINQPFNILDNDGSTKSFRVALDYFKILDNGQEVASAQEWNSNNDVLALKPTEVLAGQRAMKVSVKVHFEEKNSAGAWIAYTVGGNVEGEERVVTFTTGEAPDYITENNVKYTYPVKNMVNFYKNEYEKSYIQLNQGVDYLFNIPGNWIYLARFKSGDNILNKQVTYNSATKRVELDVPASLLNSTIYQMRILRLPASSSSLVVDKNVKNNENVVNADQSVTTKDIEGMLSEEGLTELYSLYFRTSKFNSFTEKLNSLIKTSLIETICQGVNHLKLELSGDELFDLWEVDNVKVETMVDETKWYSDNYKDLLYRSYPLTMNMDITWRVPSLVGVPPVRSCYIRQSESISLLTESNISMGSYILKSGVKTLLENRLSLYISGDYTDLRTKAFSYHPTSTDPVIVRLKNSAYSGMYYNNEYYIKIKYLIPGSTTPTSEYPTFIQI